LTTVALAASRLGAAGRGVSRAESRSRPAASSDGVGSGRARGGGGTAPGGLSVAVAVGPSRSPSVGSGVRAPRTAGRGAMAGLLGPPSVPKLDGASVSRAGSRVRVVATLAVGEAGGMTTAAGSGAVPVPLRAAAPPERTGGGGGPTDLCWAGGCPAGCDSAALEASGAGVGAGAGRGGGFGGSVKDDSARSARRSPRAHVPNTTRKSATMTSR